MKLSIEQHASDLLKWLYKNSDEVESACIARYVETHGLDAEFGQRLVGYLQSRGLADKESVLVGVEIPVALGRHRLGGPQPDAPTLRTVRRNYFRTAMRRYWRLPSV